MTRTFSPEMAAAPMSGTPTVSVPDVIAPSMNNGGNTGPLSKYAGDLNSLLVSPTFNKALDTVGGVISTVGTAAQTVKNTFSPFFKESDAANSSAYENAVASEDAIAQIAGDQPLNFSQGSPGEAGFSGEFHQAQHSPATANMPSNGLMMAIGVVAVLGAFLMLRSD